MFTASTVGPQSEAINSGDPERTQNLGLALPTLRRELFLLSLSHRELGLFPEGHEAGSSGSCL